ncbi:dihydrolipoamide acetyltransferase family protein [Lacisediminimonas profundi]|uniref:dihydrolipoamide acetyltransferase family protein n=1 Tax=Lacisediminimonas profundi TaxID=2603856 RepID=UPI00124AF9A0|nr:dihydrolipoamide acetyltransferase family protein [Lacisediminimonas profundi]
MLQKILMPKLGLTMTEGQITEWMVAPGAAFKPEQGLFVVETDKVATEIPAEGAGVLREVVVPAGTTVAVGQVVGYWDDGVAGGAGDALAAPAAATVAGRAPEAPASAPAFAPAAGQAAGAAATHGERVIATPLARRIAVRDGVDLQQIQGSGPRGRIKAADVEAAASRRVVAAPVASVAAAVPAAAGATAIDLGTRSQPDAHTAAMARRLTALKQEVPHFYLAVEANAGALLALRRELNAAAAPLRFTLNHMIVAAVGRALADLPQLNRVWANGEIVTYSSTDVGVAVHSERGLLVPVVRDAGRVSMTESARRTQAAVDSARAGTLKPDDMRGGAVTVSNAGMHQVKFMTPIINPGQAMIIGVGSISQVFRPDAHGQPVLQEEIGLVLAGDHRLMDGVAGLEFLNRVVGYIETPLRLLVGR